MKIGIQTWGSRGDVIPWIALAKGLQRNGHEVILYYSCFTNVDFSDYSIEGAAIKSTKEFCTNLSIYNNASCKKIYEKEITETFTYLIQQTYADFDQEIVAAGKVLCEQCDLIIISNLLYQLPCLAEKYNVPLVIIHVDGNFVNQDDSFESYLNLLYRDNVNALRSQLGLPMVNNVRSEIFCSSLLNLVILSNVFDIKQLDWNETVKITGFLELETPKDEVLPDDLKMFIESGTPPVFFSIGSAAFAEENLEEIIDVFVKAIRLSGCRAIIQANWPSLKYAIPADLDIYQVSYISHNLVFPHCLCVVHHAGTGLTHATLLNGCPSVVIAYAWDQCTWGQRLLSLGVASSMHRRKTIDEIQLAGSIRNIMLNPEFQYAADNARRKVKRENGVKKAVKFIEEYACAAVIQK